MMKKLSLLDFGFLLTESPESPKHVAGLMIFRIPKGYRGNFVRDLLQIISHRKPGPPFDYKLKWSLSGLPSWVEDEHIDLSYHIRHSALPKPGAMEDLMTLVARLHARLLDRNRPLWECHLIEGLRERRFAIYAKMHHALIDGVAGVMRLRASLNESPDDQTVRAFWEPVGRPSRPKRRTPPTLAERLASAAAFLGEQGEAVPELSKTAFAMGLQALGLSPGRLPIPFTAPRSPLNVPITSARRVAGKTLSLQRVKAVSKATDTTVNDVLLAVVDGALNRYLREKNALPKRPLVAQMPVSIRREGDSRSGNQIAILLVNLGSSEADPLTRLQEIKASSMEVKENARNSSAAAVTDFTLATQGLAALLETLQVSQRLPPLANVLVSNVPGPQESLYLKGAPLLACYPLSTLPAGLSLNITIHTFLDAMDFGLIADREAVPDLDLVALYLGEFFKELEAAALAGTGSLP